MCCNSSMMKMVWVHDEEMEFYVPIEKSFRYFQYGWQLGRLRECCCHCGKRFNKAHCKNHEVRCNAKKQRKLKKLKHLKPYK